VEAEGLAGFIRESVVQAKLNERGNYGMCLCRTQNFCCKLLLGHLTLFASTDKPSEGFKYEILDKQQGEKCL
jgi:hypothetical protein